MAVNTDCPANLVAEPSVIFIMVSSLVWPILTKLTVIFGHIIGTNIRTNEEVAIKLVSL